MANLSNINNKFLVTTTGEVLVGRTAATGTSKLQVSGSLLIGTDINSGIPLVVQETTADGFAIGFMRNTNATNGNGLVIDVNSTAGAYIQDWRQASTVKMRLLQNGNLGIGITDPSAKLEVKENLYVSHPNAEEITFRLDNYGTTGTDAGSVLRMFNQAGTTVVNIDSRGGSSRDTYFNGGGNVGIGTTNPSRNLTIGDGSGNSVLAIVAATNGLSQIGLGDSDDDNYGQIILRHSDGLLQIQNGGGGGISERGLNITSSEDIGIGTTSPVKKLDVRGQLAISNSASSYWYLDRNDSTGYFEIFDDGNANRLTIDTSGNVGIGVTPWVSTLPNTVIDINPAASIWGYTNSIYLNSNAYYNNGWLYKTTAAAGVLQVDGDVLRFRAAASGTANAGVAFDVPFIVDSGGNVGIGTTSPDRELHIKSSSGNCEIQLQRENFDSFFFSAGNGYLATYWAGTGTPELMRIDSGGNVTMDGSFIIGTAGNADGLRLYGGTSAGIIYSFRTASTPGSVFRWYTGTVLVGSISTTTSTTSFNTSSDYRLKENVVKMTGALDKISQLKPSRFNFIVDADRTVDGFLAHEVQEIMPEAITGEKDAIDKDGNPDYQQIDQSKLVPLLVAAIQELKADNDSLKARIETLENN